MSLAACARRPHFGSGAVALVAAALLIAVQCVSIVSAQSCTLPNCANCVPGNPNVCQTCNEGYEPGIDGQCTAVCDVAFCIACDTPTTCKGCADGYTVSADTCVKAACEVHQCELCQSSNPNVCLRCDNGEGPITPDGKCVMPPVQCMLYNCTKCVVNQSGVCEVCDQGFKLSETKTCVDETGGDGASPATAGYLSMVSFAVLLCAVWAALAL